MIEWLRGRPTALLALMAALPLLVAAIVLLGRPWVPVLDMAMTELRVRDVGGKDSPLVGLPGRIGNFPDQGSHPGPWSFYLVAIVYRLSGSSAWSMELASVVINALAIIALTSIGRRRLGPSGALIMACVAALVVRGYGLTVLTHPWNPYFPVVLWLVAAIATWSVLAGDVALAPVVTITTVIAAQTHISYLPAALVLNGTIVVWLVGWILHERRNLRAGPVKPLAAMCGIAAFAWIPTLTQQLRDGRSEGNVAKLVRHFATDQPEPSIGFGPALELMTQHFDVVGVGWGLLVRDDAFVHQAGQAGRVSAIGIVVVACWTGAAIWAGRHRHRDLIALHTVVAITLLVGVFSTSRIFGKLWFYLTLWMSTTAVLALLAIVWTLWLVVSEWRAVIGVRGDRFLGAFAAVGAVATLLSLVAIGGHRPPEERFGSDVRDAIGPTAAALDAGLGDAVGPDGTYVIFWQESGAPGTKGYALLNELDRRGYRVGVHPPWRIPATSHRVVEPGTADAEVHIVSGGFVEAWRTRGFTEVIFQDQRTEAERARFDELARRVDRRLVEIERPDLVGSVDENIFRTSLEPGLPDDIVVDLDEMLRLGEPIAVFIAPPGSTG